MNIQRCRNLGEGGNCFCPKCDFKIVHTQGTPCQQERCPKCGAKMLREGSYHYELLMRKRKL